MANTRGNENSPRVMDTTCCKCSKSEAKMNKLQCSPYLGDAVSKFEERRGDLKNREKYLRQKITTMERSIPALIAFNMLKSSENSDDSPLCKVKQMMKKLSPQLDPTDKLLEKLANTVKSLNGETAELHDKIIAADINLEESEMELESLELANKELEGTVKSLEKELKRHETPSLHSIHSDDLICLSKICQLGEAQVNLKNSIRDLEERESLFHRQMDRILKSKEFRQASCVGITKRIRQLECTERKMHCALHTQKSNVQQLKKNLARNGMELTAESSKETNSEKASGGMSNATTSRDHVNQEKSQRVKTYEELSSTKMKSIANCVCPTPICYDESSCPATSHSRGLNKCLQRSVSSLQSCCASLCSKYKGSRGQDSKISKHSSANKSTSCKGGASFKTPSKSSGFNICNPCPEQRNPVGCRCSCKGRCATDLSDTSCNCAEKLKFIDDEGKQQSDNSTRNNYQSSTDEEYCECCDCGSEDSDLSDTV